MRMFIFLVGFLLGLNLLGGVTQVESDSSVSSYRYYYVWFSSSDSSTVTYAELNANSTFCLSSHSSASTCNATAGLIWKNGTSRSQGPQPNLVYALAVSVNASHVVLNAELGWFQGACNPPSTKNDTFSFLYKKAEEQFKVTELNSQQKGKFSSVKFSASRALASQIAFAKNDMKVKNQLIIASPSKLTSSVHSQLIVDDFYLPVLVCCNTCLCINLQFPVPCSALQPQVYTITPDIRLCPSPSCGGYWYSAVNEATTICIDGSSASKCYAANLLGRIFGPSPTLVNASVTAYSSAFPLLASLDVVAAWYPATCAAAQGSFFKVQSLPSVSTKNITIKASLLNTAQVKTFTKLNLTLVTGALASDVTLGEEDLVTGDLVVASTTTNGSVLVPNQFYLPDIICCLSCLCVKPGNRTLPCPSTCQPNCAKPCNSTSFCDLNTNNDSWNCQIKPSVCPEYDRPVCGCNGVTYPNDCFREVAGVGSSSPGSCA